MQYKRFTHYLQKRSIVYSLSSRGRDDIVTVTLKHPMAELLVGFDQTGACSYISMTPEFFNFADTFEGYTSDGLLGLSEALLDGRYSVKMGRGLLVDRAKITVTTSSGETYVGSSRVPKELVPLLKSAELFKALLRP